MILYVNRTKGFTIKIGEPRETVKPGDQFIHNNIKWIVDEVVPCEFSGNFTNIESDYLAKCVKVKEYLTIFEEYFKPNRDIADVNPDFWINGLKISPDGKSQGFEKDGRLWHRTLKDNRNWNPWVEYV